jgi:hypothetical protein
MATRSTIAVEHEDGTVSAISAHWDGYLEHNGKLLASYYDSRLAAEFLISKGSLSSLGKKVGTKHPFSPHDSGLSMDEYEAKYGDMCTYYGRDRGEEDTEPTKFSSYDEYLEKLQSEEFNYILRDVDGEPVWFVTSYDDDDGPVRLSEALKSVSCN